MRGRGTLSHEGFRWEGATGCRNGSVFAVCVHCTLECAPDSQLVLDDS